MAQWINSFRMSFTTLVTYIPLIATVLTCFFSVILARATLRYVEATDKGLALAREEFEREWTPDLHIKLERVSTTEARVVVTNLAKSSVLLQLLQLRKISHAVPFERCRLNDPLVGGMTLPRSWASASSPALEKSSEPPDRCLHDLLLFRTDVPHRLVSLQHSSPRRPHRQPRTQQHAGPPRARG